MNTERWMQITLGLFVGVALVGIVLFLSAGPPSDGAEAESGSSIQSLDQTAVVSGTFSGVVDLNWVLTGVYSQTLATPTPMPGGSTKPGHVGDLDLSLRLEQVNTRVSGYVLLERSLAFPHEHTVMLEGEAFATGPRVSGTYDGATLKLESERFSILMSPEQRPANPADPNDVPYVPERRVTRQFSLTSTASDLEGGKLVGEYRETMWGNAIKPSTVIGGFTISRPIVVINVPTGGPTTTPGGPTATPGGPTATPGGPTATPGGPTATPSGPTATPGGPTATPGGPTATPGGPTPAPLFLPILQPITSTDGL